MKKTIFKGEINGEVFSNVNDYNARILELMNDGKEINAKTEFSHEILPDTKNEDITTADLRDELESKNGVCEGKCNGCECCGKCEQDQVMGKVVLPYFKDGVFDFEAFMSDYNLEDKSVREMQEVINKLKADTSEFVNHLKNNDFKNNGYEISVDDCEELVKQINELYNNIEEDIKDCESDINEAEGYLTELKQELEYSKADRKKYIAENVCLNVYRHALNEILFCKEKEGNENLQPKTSIRTTREQKEVDLDKAFSKFLNFIFK